MSNFSDICCMASISRPSEFHLRSKVALDILLSHPVKKAFLRFLLVFVKIFVRLTPSLCPSLVLGQP